MRNLRRGFWGRRFDWPSPLRLLRGAGETIEREGKTKEPQAMSRVVTLDGDKACG